MTSEVETIPARSFWSQPDARTPKLEKGGAPMTFALATVKTESGPRPLLFSAFSFSTTFADRFTRSMPAPIFVVAVNRATGAVCIRELTRDNEPPVAVRHSGAAPKPAWSVDGKSVEGPDVQVGGSVTVDLAAHLGLPRMSAVYDVFLWVDEYATDTQELKTSGELEDVPEPALYRRTENIVTVSPAQTDELQARVEADADGVWIKGTTPDGPVTVLAVSAIKRQIGWTRFITRDGESTEFAVGVRDLIDEYEPGDRFVAFVFAGGERSALLDSANL